MRSFFFFFLFFTSLLFGEKTPLIYHKKNDFPQGNHEKFLVEHAKNSIERAIQLESKLSAQNFQDILDKETWRKKIILPVHNSPLKNIPELVSYHLLNNLCSLPKASHLHVGLLAGDSFIAALYGNQTTLNQQIGIDWYQECPQNLLYQNCDLFLARGSYQLINGDCFAINKKIFNSPIDIYFYDADHSILGQQNAFFYYNDIFANPFIAIIDDWDCPWIRTATFKAFDRLGYSVLYDSVVSFKDHRRDTKLEYVAVVRKGPHTTMQKTRLTLNHDIPNVTKQKKLIFASIKQEWCSKEKASLIIDLILAESPEVCVEIGAFSGNSFLPMVSALYLAKKGHAHAIDAWSNKVAVDGLPASKHYDWWSTLDMKSIYTSFRKTLSDQRLLPYFTVHRCSSEAAVSKFSEIDFLHMDGSFSEKGAQKDLELYFPKVKKGGYILLSNVFFCINGSFSKSSTLCALIKQCEVIAEIDHNNTILFKKL